MYWVGPAGTQPAGPLAISGGRVDGWVQWVGERVCSQIWVGYNLSECLILHGNAIPGTNPKVNCQASWIDAALSPNGEFYVGCLVCGHAAGGAALRFGNNCKLWQLECHADSESHKRHVLGLVDVDPGAKLLESKAPKLGDFLKALTHFHDGRGCNTLDGVASRRKLVCMEHVMVEAVRGHWRDQLRSSTSISLLRDERHKRLLLAFRCVGATLELTHGIMGQSRSYSSTSLGINDATLELIIDLCTPSCVKGKQGEADQALLDYIRSHVHCTTVDDASNEVAAVVDSTAPAEMETRVLHERKYFRTIAW